MGESDESITFLPNLAPLVPVKFQSRLNISMRGTCYSNVVTPLPFQLKHILIAIIINYLGKDPALFARGRDNFNSYHMSTLGRTGSGRTPSAAAGKEPVRNEEEGIIREQWNSTHTILPYRNY